MIIKIYRTLVAATGIAGGLLLLCSLGMYELGQLVLSQAIDGLVSGLILVLASCCGSKIMGKRTSMKCIGDAKFKTGSVTYRRG